MSSECKFDAAVGLIDTPTHMYAQFLKRAINSLEIITLRKNVKFLLFLVGFDKVIHCSYHIVVIIVCIFELIFYLVVCTRYARCSTASPAVTGSVQA